MYPVWCILLNGNVIPNLFGKSAAPECQILPVEKLPRIGFHRVAVRAPMPSVHVLLVPVSSEDRPVRHLSTLDAILAVYQLG